MLADPGSAGTTVATARAASTPGVYVIDVPDTANSITTNYAMPVGLTGINAGFLVTGISFIKQGGDGHSDTNTIQVFNGASAVSDASSFTSKTDQSVTSAASLNDANTLVAAGGSLVIQLIKGGAGNSAHRVVVSGILIETL